MQVIEEWLVNTVESLVVSLNLKMIESQVAGIEWKYFVLDHNTDWDEKLKSYYDCR